MKKTDNNELGSSKKKKKKLKVDEKNQIKLEKLDHTPVDGSAMTSLNLRLVGGHVKRKAD